MDHSGRESDIREPNHMVRVCYDGCGAFKVGDRVRCRFYGEEWKLGTVTDLDGPMVCVDGWNKAYTWYEVEPARPEPFPSGA
eukprot:gene13705-biopygen7831